MIKVLSSKTLYSEKFSAVRERLESNRGVFDCETIRHPGGVVVLPITADERIVCVSQYRHAVGKELLELPAGTFKGEESPMECARRELAEETGWGTASIVSLGIQYPAPEFCNELQHVFVATGLYSDKGTPDDDEDICVRILCPEEFIAGIRQGLIVDAKSIALFYRALLFGFFNN